MDALKWKVIDDYNYFMKLLKNGYTIKYRDYVNILNTISFIDLHSLVDKKEFIKEYFLNK